MEHFHKKLFPRIDLHENLLAEDDEVDHLPFKKTGVYLNALTRKD